MADLRGSKEFLNLILDNMGTAMLIAEEAGSGRDPAAYSI